MKKVISAAIIVVLAVIVFASTQTNLKHDLISQINSFSGHHSIEDTTLRILPQTKARLISTCAQADAKINRESLDLNGDNKKDHVCWETITTSNSMTYFHLVARVESDTGRVQTAYSLLPVDAGQQIGLCPSSEIQVTTTYWSEEEFKDLFDTYSGPVSLTISDGICDPVWLFWPQDNQDAEVLFDVYRM